MKRLVNVVEQLEL